MPLLSGPQKPPLNPFSLTVLYQHSPSLLSHQYGGKRYISTNTSSLTKRCCVFMRFLSSETCCWRVLCGGGQARWRQPPAPGPLLVPTKRHHHRCAFHSAPFIKRPLPNSCSCVNTDIILLFTLVFIHSCYRLPV